MFVALLSPVVALLVVVSLALGSSTSIFADVDPEAPGVEDEAVPGADSGSVVRFSIATVTLELESPLVPELGEKVCCSSVPGFEPEAVGLAVAEEDAEAVEAPDPEVDGS